MKFIVHMHYFTAAMSICDCCSAPLLPATKTSPHGRTVQAQCDLGVGSSPALTQPLLLLG